MHGISGQTTPPKLWHRSIISTRYQRIFLYREIEISSRHLEESSSPSIAEITMRSDIQGLHAGSSRQDCTWLQEVESEELHRQHHRECLDTSVFTNSHASCIKGSAAWASPRQHTQTSSRPTESQRTSWTQINSNSPLLYTKASKTSPITIENKRERKHIDVIALTLL